MLFNSYIFIFLFLPLALSGYFILNRFKAYSVAKAFLVAMSLWFYAYFHMSYFWIIISSIAWNYFCHRWILRNRKFSKYIVALGICGNLGLLIYYKYFDFLMDTMNKVFHAHLTLTGVLLPLGISFFTFQQIGFLADTAKGEVSEQRIIDYALFVVFFPQLIAGPIVNSSEMLPQFQEEEKKRFSPESMYIGLNLFILGLFKKVLLADTFGKAVDWGYRYYELLDSMNSLIVIVFYSIQLYMDFSGYCDMARGIGKMFNIELPVNFDSPFKAKNILDFWDRWHITLTRFFTKYVYIPLGGNRKGLARTCVNVMIVFILSGFWHGANWTFVVWGCLHGILSVFTRLYKSIVKKHRFSLVGRVFTFIFVAFAFAIFRADSVSQAIAIINRVFDFDGFKVFPEIAGSFRLAELDAVLRLLNLDRLSYASYLCMGVVTVSTCLIIWFFPNLKQFEKKYLPYIMSSVWGYLWAVVLAGLGIWSVISLAGVSSFLYFNF